MLSLLCTAFWLLVGVAIVYPHSNPNLLLPQGTASYETYIANQRNLDVTFKAKKTQNYGTEFNGVLNCIQIV